MTVNVHFVILNCDCPRCPGLRSCDAAHWIEGRSTAEVRKRAAAEGWLTVRTMGGKFKDFCPDCRSNYEAAR